MQENDYVELRTRSAFSFLEGASTPEDLIEHAARLGYSALALGDLDGVYGAPRFHQAGVRTGVRAIVGARISLQVDEALPERASSLSSRAPNHAATPPTLLLLVESPRGWKALSRLLTLAHADRPKGK